MKSVLLPVGDPMIKGYLFFAYPLSIISQSKKSEPWVFSNFIQMCFEKDYMNSPVPYTFYSYDSLVCPWLYQEKLTRRTVSYFSEHIIDFVKYAIDNKKYIYLYLNEYHVPNRGKYQEELYIHENLLFGYDDSTQSVDVLGFNEQMIFKKTKITYEQLQQAFATVESIHQERDLSQTLHKNSFDYFNIIHLFEFNEDGQYAFNPKLVKDMLVEYLNGTNTSERFAMVREPLERAYGLECYTNIIEYYEALLRNECHYDIRYLHNLWEHKVMMSKRMKYMMDHQYSSLESSDLQEHLDLEKLVLSLRNKMIKYSITNNRAQLESIVDHLHMIEEGDVAIIQKCISSI